MSFIGAALQLYITAQLRKISFRGVGMVATRLGLRVGLTPQARRLLYMYAWLHNIPYIETYMYANVTIPIPKPKPKLRGSSTSRAMFVE